MSLLQVDPLPGHISRNGPYHLSMQPQAGEDLHEGSLLPGPGCVRTNGPVEVPPGICLSTNPVHLHVSWKTLVRERGSSCRDSTLAKQALVFSAVAILLLRPSASTCQTESPVTGPSVAPMSSLPPPGLAPQRKSLAGPGCSSRVVSTLISSRRASTNRVYNRIWSRFVTFTAVSCVSCTKPQVHNILDFLQSCLDLGLSISSFKVQIFALSAFTSVACANHLGGTVFLRCS